jgi:hypothetical protein
MTNFVLFSNLSNLSVPEEGCSRNGSRLAVIFPLRFLGQNIGPSTCSDFPTAFFGQNIGPIPNVKKAFLPNFMGENSQ